MKPASLWSRVTALAATPLTPSHYVGLVRPLAATHVRVARVERVTTECPGVATLLLRPGRGWEPHVPGQHVQIGVELDGRIVTRCYSISSAPARDHLTITIKAQGRVSNALVAIAPGSYVRIGAPAGNFVLSAADRVLFVTGGSGITPIMSMLRSARTADIAHVHFARDIMFATELQGAHVITDGRRLTPALLDELVPDWATRSTWACGPESLLEASRFTHDLHIERFRPQLVAVPDAHGGRVRFLTSRTSAIADGTTPLLDIAERAGVAVPHGCRMGICHTCDATLAGGCVRDLRTGERITASGTRIQVCVCAAAGDVEVAL